MVLVQNSIQDLIGKLENPEQTLTTVHQLERYNKLKPQQKEMRFSPSMVVGTVFCLNSRTLILFECS